MIEYSTNILVAFEFIKQKSLDFKIISIDKSIEISLDLLEDKDLTWCSREPTNANTLELVILEEVLFCH